jgi:hypothetical protein
LASNILGTSHNRLGDRWHITAGTEKKNLPKSAGCVISGKAPWNDLWHIADVTARYANGRTNNCIAPSATVSKLDAIHSKTRRIW